MDFFLRSDEREGDDSVHTSAAERDRDIYLNHIQPFTNDDQTASSAHIIRAWLEQRRESEKTDTGSQTVLPGEIFDESYRLLGTGLLILGIMAGAGLAFSFLNYKGTAPLNVSVYLGGFILPQVLLLLLFLGTCLIRKAMRSTLHSSVIHTLLRKLMTRMIVTFKRRALKNLTGSKRDSLEAMVGLVKERRPISGSLFYWPVFMLVQLFGIGFNLGLLGATLLKVLGSDIAFGWQSTVQLSAQAVYELVRFIALPWSWILTSGIAYPTLAQIEGSRMILKDGIYHLATENLVAWWPFLCLAVLCYGLLPRLILLVIGHMAQRRAIGLVDFGHSACERLLFRLRTPLIHTAGRPLGVEHPQGNEAKGPKIDPPDHEGAVRDKGLIALIPEEIFDLCHQEEFERRVAKSLGYSVRQIYRFGSDEEADRGILYEISLIPKENSGPDVLILQEAWQPPIKENFGFIKDLRKAVGKASHITIGLIGRPRPDYFFTGVKEEDWQAWHQKLKTLADPYLGLERLVVDDD